METVTASILKMIYAKEDSGFKVMVTRTQAGKSLIITGEFGPEIIPETVATFHGKYGSHPKYGHQFKALSYMVVHNAQELASVKIFLNSITDKVGPERSEAIIAYFGTDTLNIIENTPDRLTEVPGIGKVIASNIVAAWQENRHKWSAEKIIYSLRAFLMSIGLREKRIKKVLDHFGGRETHAEDVIRENPYSLTELDDFGFTTVDFIAKQLGFKDSSPLRFKAFILYMMEFISPSNGHLFLTTYEINEALIKYSSENNTQFLEGQVTDFTIFQYVKELVSEDKLILDESRIYSKKQFNFESKSASLLAQIALEESDLLFLTKEKVDDFITTFEHEHSWILSEEQRKALYYFVEKKVFVITGLPGSGKCLGKNTPVMLFDGTVKMVQDIKRGDLLMGDDSSARKVLSITKGQEELYSITPVKGDPYIVNKSHILSLKKTGTDEVIDIALLDYIEKPSKERYKGYKVPVQFKESPVPIDPYLLGYWLGNGSKDCPRISTSYPIIVNHLNKIVCKDGISVKKVKGDNIEYDLTCDRDSDHYKNLLNKKKPNDFLYNLKKLNLINNKHIPLLYKTNSREIRLQLLAGLLDSDGYFNSNCYEFSQKAEVLAKDVEYLARSLGFSAYAKLRKKSWNSFSKGKRYKGEDHYYVMHICGKGLEQIPTVIDKKKASIRKQIKNVLLTGIKVRPIGVGDYYGFQIDGNGRFLLGDFTVTHNTTVLKAVVDLALSLKLNLTCMTPTGISAKKLSGVIQNDAYTIHRKLGFRGNKWTFDEINQFHTDVAIVDEASMVDQEVFYRLLSALKKRTHLIFVGDHNQLPSVGAGNVLRELINCNQIPVVKLDKIFRQEEASDIIKASHKIIHGDTNLELFKKDPGADIFFMRVQDPQDIEQIIIKLASKFKDERREFQIISARNDGPLGINPLNNILQAALNPPAPHLAEVKMPYFIIRVGDRIIVKKNDYENEIFNGDIGKVTFIGSGKVMIKIDDRLIPLTIDEVNDKIKLAYGITIHKCLPGSALIFTSKGYSPLRDIQKGSSVHTKNGSFPVFDHFKTGKKVAYKITTRTNSTYICSEDHPYFVTDKNSFPDYKPAKNIKTTDYLTIYRNCIKSGVNQPIEVDNSSIRATSINLPENFDEDLCWLIAVIIGDTNSTDEDDGIIELSGPTKIDILDRFKSILNRFGITTHDRLKKGKLYGRYIISKNFRNWLLGIGLDYSKAATKSIPPIIFNCNNSCRASFIGGLVDTDGCMDRHPSMRYTTASEKLADDLKILLLSMGIVSFKTKQNDVHYKIQITGYDLELFREIIPIYHTKKNKILFSYKITTKTNHYEIPQDKLLIELFLKAFKDHEGNSQGKKGKGLFAKYPGLAIKLSDIQNKVNTLRRPVLLEMQKTAIKEGFQLPVEISEYLNNNWYFDKVIKIEKLEEQEMFDIEVTDEHSYIHQGAICHNSQGLEYETIILPFINQYGKNMLQRNLLYTALTRARKKIIVLGHGSAIEKAIENISVTKRNTILGERIKECLHQKRKPFLLEQPLELNSSPDAPISKEPASLGGGGFYPMGLIEE